MNLNILNEKSGLGSLKNGMNLFKKILLALLLAQWSEIKMTWLLFTLQLNCTGSFHGTLRHPGTITDTGILTEFLNRACCSSRKSCSICAYVCHIVLFYELVLFWHSFSSPFFASVTLHHTKAMRLASFSVVSFSFLCLFITAFSFVKMITHFQSTDLFA